MAILLASSVFKNNKQQIKDAYSEPCQASKIECLIKKG